MTFMWKARDGTQQPITVMADSHLRYSLRLVQERLRQLHDQMQVRSLSGRDSAFHTMQHEAERALSAELMARGLDPLPLRSYEEVEARRQALQTITPAATEQQVPLPLPSPTPTPPRKSKGRKVYLDDDE